MLLSYETEWVRNKRRVERKVRFIILGNWEQQDKVDVPVAYFVSNFRPVLHQDICSRMTTSVKAKAPTESRKILELREIRGPER